MLAGPTASHIRDRLHLDPEACAFLGELDEVQQMLGQLSPDHPGSGARGDDLPAHLSRQLDSTLAEAARERDRAPRDPRRPRGNGSYRYVVAAVACAAAVAGMMVLSPRISDLLGTSGDATTPPGASTTGPWGFENRGQEPGQESAGLLAGERLHRCLEAAGLPRSIEVIGVEAIRPTDGPREGSPARFRVLVPAPSGAGMLVLSIESGCGPNETGILDKQVVGAPG